MMSKNKRKQEPYKKVKTVPLLCWDIYASYLHKLKDMPIDCINEKETLSKNN